MNKWYMDSTTFYRNFTDSFLHNFQFEPPYRIERGMREGGCQSNSTEDRMLAFMQSPGFIQSPEPCLE